MAKIELNWLFMKRSHFSALTGYFVGTYKVQTSKPYFEINLLHLHETFLMQEHHVILGVMPEGNLR